MDQLNSLIALELMAAAAIVIPVTAIGIVFCIVMLCREWAEADREEKDEPNRGQGEDGRGSTEGTT